MSRKMLLFLIMGVLGTWYQYTPIPENTEQPWALMCMDESFKALENLVSREFYNL